MTDYPMDFGNGYKIQTVYANKTAEGCYGDVYDFESDVIKEHPGAEILKGYCVIDEASGLVPDNCNDWNDSIPAAIQDYEQNIVPDLLPTLVLCLADTKEDFVNSDPTETYELNSLEDCLYVCTQRREAAKAYGRPDYYGAYVVAEDGSNPWTDIFDPKEKLHQLSARLEFEGVLSDDDKILQCGICGNNFFVVFENDSFPVDNTFSLYTIDNKPNDLSITGIMDFMLKNRNEGASVTGTKEQIMSELEQFKHEHVKEMTIISSDASSEKRPSLLDQIQQASEKAGQQNNGPEYKGPER